MKKLFFGTITFALGVTTGYFVTTYLLREQYKNDVADIQAFYNQKLEEFGVMEEGYEPPEEEAKPAADLVQAYREDGRKLHYDYTKPSLGELQKRITSGSVIVEPNGEELLGVIDANEEEDNDFDAPDLDYEAELEQIAEEYARTRTENMKNGNPYIIDADEYHQGPKEYEHQALYYYVEDRTLCEDDDSIVEDEEECIGFEYEDVLTMQTTCWVRNDKLKMLYEIHRIDDSYKKAVQGILENPREREFRIQGRRKEAMDNRVVTPARKRVERK